MTDRIGLLGGTFDPPHIGHVAAARAALCHLKLHRLLVTVANDPWQKSANRTVTAPAHRLTMTRMAFADVAGTSVLDLEIVRGGPSYTVDTATELRRTHPGARMWMVIGAREVAGLPTWERVMRLSSLVKVGILMATSAPDAHTGPADLVPSGWHATTIPMDLVDVSSTQVREIVCRSRSHGTATREDAAAREDATDENLTSLVPVPVAQYIRRHNLYRDG